MAVSRHVAEIVIAQAAEPARAINGLGIADMEQGAILGAAMLNGTALRQRDEKTANSVLIFAVHVQTPVKGTELRYTTSTGTKSMSFIGAHLSNACLAPAQRAQTGVRLNLHPASSR